MLPNRKSLCMAAVMLFGGCAYGDSLVVGSGGTSIRFPFGSDATSTTNYQAGASYQQIYDASEFSSPITITQIAFATTSNLSTATLDALSLDVHLGIAGTSAADPSATFATNRGTTYTDVFNGAYSFTPAKNDTFDLVLTLTTPFSYMPSRGDLLLDVELNTAPAVTGSTLYFAGNSSDTDARIYSVTPSSTGQVDFNTLETRFTFTSTATPEPGTWSLLSAGAALLLIGLIRRSKGIAVQPRA